MEIHLLLTSNDVSMCIWLVCVCLSWQFCRSRRLSDDEVRECKCARNQYHQNNHFLPIEANVSATVFFLCEYVPSAQPLRFVYRIEQCGCYVCMVYMYWANIVRLKEKWTKCFGKTQLLVTLENLMKNEIVANAINLYKHNFGLAVHRLCTNTYLVCSLPHNFRWLENTPSG